MLYVYVGSESIYGAQRLTFGRRIELGDAQAEELMLAHVALVPFSESGFNADELKKYGSPAAREAAPQDFKNKHCGAIAKYSSTLAELQAGKKLSTQIPAPIAPKTETEVNHA